MASQRLDLRLDPEHRRRLQELAAEQDATIVEAVRRLIDRAYEETLLARRRRAAQELARLHVEEVPDPATLNQQLEAAHEPGGLS